MKKVLGVFLLLAMIDSSAFASPKSPLIRKLMNDVKLNPINPIAQKLQDDAKKLLDKKAKLRSDVVKIVRRMESGGSSIYDPNMGDFMKFYKFQKQLVGIDRQLDRLAKIKQSVEDRKEEVLYGLMFLPNRSIEQVDFLKDARDRQRIAHAYALDFKAQCSADELDKNFPVNYSDALVHFANDFSYVKSGVAH